MAGLDLYLLVYNGLAVKQICICWSIMDIMDNGLALRQINICWSRIDWLKQICIGWVLILAYWIGCIYKIVYIMDRV